MDAFECASVNGDVCAVFRIGEIGGCFETQHVAVVQLLFVGPSHEEVNVLVGLSVEMPLVHADVVGQERNVVVFLLGGENSPDVHQGGERREEHVVDRVDDVFGVGQGLVGEAQREGEHLRGGRVTAAKDRTGDAAVFLSVFLSKFLIFMEFVVIGLHLVDFPELRCDAVDVISGPIAEVKVVHQGGKIGGGIGGGAHGRAVDDLEVLVDLDGVELHLQRNVDAKRMPNDVAIAAVPLLLPIELHLLHHQGEFSHHESHLVLHQTVGFWGDDLLAEVVQGIRRAFDFVVEVRIVGAGLNELEGGVYGFPVVDQVVMVTLVFRLLDVRPQHRHVLASDLQGIE